MKRYEIEVSNTEGVFTVTRELTDDAAALIKGIFDELNADVWALSLKIEEMPF